MGSPSVHSRPATRSSFARAIKVAAALWLGAGAIACGPGEVRLRPAKYCDGGNLKDCKSRCSANEARACYRLGWFHETGQKVVKSEKRAVRLYKQACDGKMATACRALAIIYERGDEVKRSKKKAWEYNQKACRMGVASACPTAKEVSAAKKKQGGNGGVDVDVDAPDAPNAPDAPSAPNAPSGPEVPQPTVPTPGL